MSAYSVPPPSALSPTFIPSQLNIEGNYQCENDGFMCAGRTWNIVDIHGSVEIFEKLLVDQTPVMYFQGFSETSERNCYYSISFANLGHRRISLLVISGNMECESVAGTQGTPVKDADMCKTFLKIIKDVVMATQTKTCKEWLQKNQSVLKIYEEDWEEIGNMLSTKLNSGDEEIRGAFPDKSSFYFLFACLDWDSSLSMPLGIEEDNFTPYPDLRLHNVDKVAFHIAFDYEAEHQCLFFNPSFPNALNASPTFTYNPCILPDAYDYIYFDIPTNDQHIVAIQQSTQLFYDFNKNYASFFDKAFIARTMLQAYLRHMEFNFQSLPHWHHIAGEALITMFSRLKHSLRSNQAITAQCKLIWNKKLNGKSDTYLKLIHQAVTDSHAYMSQAFPSAEFTIYPKQEISEYILQIFETFFQTIYDVRDFVTDLPVIPVLHQPLKMRSLTLQDFANVFVAEAMTRRIARGDFSGFPNEFKDFILPGKNPDGSLLKWPFKNEFMRRNDYFMLSVNLKTTTCFGDVAHLLGALQISDKWFHSAYMQWNKIEKASTLDLENSTCRLFSKSIYAFLKSLLSYHGLLDETKIVIPKLWEHHSQLQLNPSTTALSTLTLYSKLLEISRFRIPTLQLSLLFLEFLKTEYSDASAHLSAAVDKMIYESGVPLMFLITHRKMHHVFVPTSLPATFCSDRITSIYEHAFFVSYRRTFGSNGIQLRELIEPVVCCIQRLPVDSRPKCIASLFEVINKMLDDRNEAMKMPVFNAVPEEIKRILLHPFAAVPRVASEPEG